MTTQMPPQAIQREIDALRALIGKVKPHALCVHPDRCFRAAIEALKTGRLTFPSTEERDAAHYALNWSNGQKPDGPAYILS